jgi:hypothetical protein
MLSSGLDGKLIWLFTANFDHPLQAMQATRLV